MTVFDQLSKKELKELLVKNWMTHDGDWFLHACLNFGIEKVNRINKAAIATLAGIEMRRLMKAMGMRSREDTTFEEN